MGDAIVADVKLTLQALVAAAGTNDREPPSELPAAPEMEISDPLSPSTVCRILNEKLPDDAIIVLESPSSTMSLRNQLRISKPNSYFFGAGGGLGFGLSAAIGIQIAEPDRQVVCVIGEGSLQYAVAAFWTAVAYKVPVTFLVMRNEEYAILKWFADIENVPNSPGLDLPALESADIAAGYGLGVAKANSVADVGAAIEEALADDMPRLVEVPVQPGMSLF